MTTAAPPRTSRRTDPSRNRPPRRSGRRLVVLVVAFVVVDVVLVVLALGRRADGPDPRPPDPPVASDVARTANPGPTVAFLGAAGAPDGHAAQLGRRYDWRVANTTVVGGAFTGAAPYDPGQVAAAIGAAPGAVIVESPVSDSTAKPAALRAAVAKVLADLRAALPAARIVLVGPIVLQASPEVLAERDLLRSAAEQARVPFVDPIASGWLEGAPDLVGREGLTPAGEVRVAERLAGDLVRLNVAPA